MRTIILLLIIVPSIAHAAVQLNMKDKSRLCGEYVENDRAYCRNIVGGDICVQKSEIASVMKVSECSETIEVEAKGTDYLKSREMTQQDLIIKNSVRNEGRPYKAKKRSAYYEDE